jgi:hypothetical protein
LPPEVLESLANNNYTLARPRPIDPAVFYDLLKIRRLVDEASDLAVRAASGVPSSQISNSMNHGLLGNAGAALGLGLGGGGSNAKLSRERIHRMREQATQKLSKAYHLDEIACSVATMQSASLLEDVAHLVLQRSPNNCDAKYVHFFHEKIPSRQLAECTSLQPLTDIIAQQPGDGEPLRTRAVTKIFKDDYVGAAQDLTLGLQLCRYRQIQHKAKGQELELAARMADERRSSRWRDEFRLVEEDQPSSLETQLLFLRANVYLTLAYKHVEAALPSKGSSHNHRTDHGPVSPGATKGVNGHCSPDGTDGSAPDSAEQETQRRRSEARKMVKTYAKRALRDYTAFLSHFDYTPGLPAEVTEEFMRRVNLASNGHKPIKSYTNGKAHETNGHSTISTASTSTALVASHQTNGHGHGHHRSSSFNIPPPVLYSLSTLFSSIPPTDIPPFPSPTTPLTSTKTNTSDTHSLPPPLHSHESLTYHPLLPDALHSLLLSHCLVQTSPTELKRHALMVARCARLCGGYPIFQSARSPGRADWIEILRLTHIIDLNGQSWENLCPAGGAKSVSGGRGGVNGKASGGAKKEETKAEREEKKKRQNVLEALEDERVCDEESFQKALRARQRREEMEEEERRASQNGQHAAGAQAEKGPKFKWDEEKGFTTSTERAEAIVRWIREAPVVSDGGGTGKKKRKGGGKKRGSPVDGSM